MGRWLKRLRGVLGLGVVGGAVGALFGGLMWFGSSVLGLGSIVFEPLGLSAAVWGVFGAFAASGAGLLLTTLGSRQTLEELSHWRVGAFGAVMGFLAPPIFVFLNTGSFWGPGAGPFAVVATITAISTLLGAGIGSGLVLTAQRAPSQELASGRLGALGSGESAEG